MIYFGCFSFYTIHLELKRQVHLYARGSPENHTRFKTFMDKIFTHLQTKTAQKPYPLGRHIPIQLKRGSTSPPPPPDSVAMNCWSDERKALLEQNPGVLVKQR